MEIIFENEDCLVLNKPAGVIVHPDGMSDAPSVTAWVAEKYPALAGVGGDFKLASGGESPRNGAVHRIDRETSGVLLIAKNQPAFEFFKKQFLDRTVGKAYRAFLAGELPSEKLSITLPIGRSAADFRRWTATEKTRGKIREAETEFTVLERGHEAGGGNGAEAKSFTYAEALPKTGRTHQIRVHAKAAGYPIVGDKLYGTGAPALGFSRMALHAFSISFDLRDGKRAAIEAPIPADFEAALAALR
jgi:23S rRNA pseudouridine1911/1915/1917 synthase